MPFSIYALLGVPSSHPSSSSKDTNTNTQIQNRTKFDPAHKFVTSPVRPFYSNPLYLAGLRVLVATYIWLVLLVTLIWKSVKLHQGSRYVIFTPSFFPLPGPKLPLLSLTLLLTNLPPRINHSYFSYFTYLTYIGLCAYYTSSAYHTLSYALRWRRRGAGAGYPLQFWTGRLGRLGQALYVVLHATVVTFREFFFCCFLFSPFFFIFFESTSGVEFFFSSIYSSSTLAFCVLFLQFLFLLSRI